MAKRSDCRVVSYQRVGHHQRTLAEPRLGPDVAVRHDEDARFEYGAVGHECGFVDDRGESLARNVHFAKGFFGQYVAADHVDAPHEMVVRIFEQFLHVVRPAEHGITADLCFVVVDEAGHLPLEVAEPFAVVFDTGSDHASVAFAADDDYFFIHNKL